MKKVFFMLAIAVALPISSQVVEQSLAQRVAVKLYREHYSSNANGVVRKMHTVSSDSSANILHIAEYVNGGFSVISGERLAPPVLGYCETGSYDEDEMPQGLLYLLNRYEAEITEIRRINNTSVSLRSEQQQYQSDWDYYLSDETNNQLRSYNPGHFMLDTKWGQRNGFNVFCPRPNDKIPAGCTAVAMAQILHYWGCRIVPHGTHSYLWKKGDRTLSANFGETQYNWLQMDASIANNHSATLVYHAGVSCEMNYGNGASVSTPNRARDGFVKFWGINQAADVKWRIWHLRTWKDDLKKELDKGRPILYSGGGVVLREPKVSGHSWVIDGYNSRDKFHCNWGNYGNHNGWFSLGDFILYDEKGNVKSRYNELESAIFNVEPVLSVGVGTPQFHSSGWTSNFNVNGEELEVDPVYGATHYEWSTDKGRIVSDDSNKAVLYTTEDATVRVRAYNSLCDVHSDYASVRVRVKNLPEIADSYASAGNARTTCR